MGSRGLPSQIRKVVVRDRRSGRSVVRYEVRVDAGVDASTGARRQTKRRCETEADARRVLAEIQGQAVVGLHVSRSTVTVDQVCEAYMAGRHNLRATSRTKLAYDLGPLRERHGSMAVQRLTKRHLDQLVSDLVAGGTVTGKGRVRKPWAAVSVNKMTATIGQVLADALAQGLVVRNVAANVARVTAAHKDVATFTPAEVGQLRAAFAGDRLGHAWELALYGLRRGEIAGLRWADVDFDAGTLAIVNNRVDAGGRAVENDPKSAASRRVLPLPARLPAVLAAARERQAAERLVLGEHYGPGDYVVCNEAGQPYNPQVVSRYWASAVRRAGLRHIKLHGGRHTAATLMHLDGVPTSVIAAWIGHSDPGLTLRVYAHSQDDALKAAGAALDSPGGLA